MSIIGSTVRFLILLANIIVGAGFLICAYSPYANPMEYPLWACTGLLFPFFLLLNFVFLLFWLIHKWKYAWLPALIFLIGWEATWNYIPFNLGKDSESKESIKILTYNIWEMKGEKDGNKDASASITDYIKNCGADIVCLQEFPTKDAKLRKSLSSVYPYIKTYSVYPGYGIACLSKYPILSSKRIHYKSIYNCSALFNIKQKKDTLAVICNHLETNRLNKEDKQKYKSILKSPDKQQIETGKYLLHKYAEAAKIRAVQADSVARAIHQNQARYLIVCGDLNDTPISYTYRVISEGLQDAYAETGVGPGFSYNRNLLYFRIDHIMANDNFRIIQCKVDRSIRLSDHYPVWCRLEKK